LDALPDNRTELDNEDKITRLLTSAYSNQTYAQYLTVMSDDYDRVSDNYSASSERALEDAWYWRDDRTESGDSPKDTWEGFYNAIAHSNNALQAIELLGNPRHLDPQRGEALVTRAWSHFKLVNVFCQHYSKEFSDTDLGIPYMETPETEVNPHYDRGSVKDVYEKIERDLLAGLPLIDDAIYSVPAYHFNRAAALGFAAEFYLFYQKYDECIKYANQVLGLNPQSYVRDLTGFAVLPFGEVQTRAYIKADIRANLLLLTNYSQAGLNVGYGYNNRYILSELLAYTEGLLAPSVLWRTSGINTSNTFYANVGGWDVGGGPAGFARFTVPYIFELTDPVQQIGYAHSVMLGVTGENVLLCRAEAYALTNNFQAAMDDINTWVSMRVKPPYNSPKTVAQLTEYYGGLPYYTPTEPTLKKTLNPETPFTSSEQESFIHAILHLRRVEFYNEGTRWFDIKRYNIEIVRRVVTGETDVETAALDKLSIRDKRMAVQLPSGVLAAGMVGNPR
jgi:tetratricopeptide (TPR) repeat protein